MITPAEPQEELLTEEERFALEILIEECGEVLQAVGKTRRFGLDSHNPEDPTKQTNRSRLEQELGDVIGMVVYLEKMGVRDGALREEHRREALRRKRDGLLLVAERSALLAQVVAQLLEYQWAIPGQVTRASVSYACREMVTGLLAAVDHLVGEGVVQREAMLRAAGAKQMKVYLWSKGKLVSRPDAERAMEWLQTLNTREH